MPADDDFAAAIESEHSASERVLRGDSTALQETCTQAGEMSLAEPISWRQ